jgi:hypothetical protein
MKKGLKLSLHRETLRLLSHEPLAGVAAGTGTQERSCFLSCFAGCSDIGCTDTCPSQIVRTGCHLTECIPDCE